MSSLAAIVCAWKSSGKGHTGPLVGPAGTIPASNKRTKVSAVQVVTVEGDKVKLTRHYFDLMSLLQQIRAIPQ